MSKLKVGALCFGVGFILAGTLGVFMTGSDEIAFAVKFFDLVEVETKAKNTLDSNEIEVLEKFSSQNQIAFTAWLKSKGIFKFTDSSLVNRINTELCQPIPENATRQERMKLSQECAAKPVAKSLRLLRDQKKVPFHYVGEDVKVGISVDKPHRPANDRANVCKTGGLLGKSIEVTDPVTENQVVVEASNYYTCSGMGLNPDIQLNSVVGRKLFDRPLEEYQDAIAVAMN